MKKTIRTWLIIVSVFYIQPNAAAQTDSIDNKAFISNDTQAVRVMTENAGKYLKKFLSQQDDSLAYKQSISFSSRAYNLAIELNDKKGISESLLVWGAAYSRSEAHKKGLELLIQALPLLRQQQARNSIARCMNLLAEDYHALGDFKPAITYYDSAYSLFMQFNDSSSAVYCLLMKGHCHFDLGNYKEAYTYEEAAYEMSAHLNIGLRTYCLCNLANLFLGADLPRATIEYMHLVKSLNPTVFRNVRDGVAWGLTRGGEAFLKLGMIDSAVAIENQLYIDTADTETMIFTGHMAVARKDYDKAISYFKTGYDFSMAHNHPMAVARHANELAAVYLLLKKYTLAIAYAHEAQQTAEKIHALQEVKVAIGKLAEIYGETKDYSKAFFYGKQYKLLSDSLASDEYRRVLAMLDVQHELNAQKRNVQLLSRENSLKENNLQQEKTIRNISITTLIALLVIGILVFRNIQLKRRKDQVQYLMEETNTQLANRKKEQKLAELEREKTDLEMQALRAQMNPHFIFNCLSSINRFILKNETEAASDYLTKFSRLIRMVLVNSKNTFISLEDELDMLRLYLDMERLRFRNTFDYGINFTNSIDLRSLFVPPLLLQPFAENAIWHGLMHKDGKGKLVVELSLKEDILYCMITDNGIGREKAAALKTKTIDKEKSLGLQITAQRLALLNKDINEPIFFEIQDLTDEDGNASGTCVTIKINCKHNEEMHV